MSQPVICEKCSRINVVKQGSQNRCSGCGHQLSGVPLSAMPGSPGRSQETPKSQKMSEEMQWSLILIACGAFFLLWAFFDPDAAVKKRWSSGPGTPVGWIGGFCMSIGVIWAFCLSVFAGNNQHQS